MENCDTGKYVMNQVLDGSLRMVYNITTSRVLSYHSNLLNEKCPFSDFTQNVCKYFYPNIVILDKFWVRTAFIDKLLLNRLIEYR